MAKGLREITFIISLVFIGIGTFSFYHYQDDIYRHIKRRFLMGKPVDISTADKTESHYQHAAVAADNRQCSRVGKDILLKNGSAVDAAIAAMLCLGVINSHSTGIGGGGFMLVYNKAKDKAEAIDFREMAPGKATVDLFGGDPMKGIKGGLAVGVPGELKGMEVAWKRHGRLPWKDLFQPAIQIASEGFRMPETLSIAVNKYKEDIKKDPDMRSFYFKDGNPIPVNGTVINIALAATLQEIAKAGNADPFYKGKFSKTIVADIKKHKGIITLKDLKNYKAIVRAAVETKLGQYKLLNFPAPASGPILAYILNVLEGYGLSLADYNENPGLVYHRIIEAFKFAYAKRSLMSDADFEPSVKNLVADMIKTSTAKKTRQKINDTCTQDVSYYGGQFSLKVKTGTTHLVVVGPNGDTVAVTSTVNGYLGAKFRSGKLGFVYNNEMDDFSFPEAANEFGLPPSPINFIKPWKRPQSSAVPVIILDEHKNVRMVAGGSGGSIITTAVAQAIINHLWLEMSLKEAIDAPRVHSQLIPDKVFVESRFDSVIAEELTTKYKHKVSRGDDNHAVVQAIARTSGEWQHHSYRKGHIHSEHIELFAVSDFRKGGKPDGF